MLAVLLFASPVAYAGDPPDEDPDTVIEIGIDGELEVGIGVSGPAELDVGVEGPSEVHIDAGDEVELNVESSDESEVFIDNDKVNDNPGGLNPHIEAGDPHQAWVSAQNVNGATGDGRSSMLNSLAIISGVFLGAGLLAFFLIRREVKEGR